MNKKICIEDIKIEWLNKRSLVLISIFTHALHKHNGVVIDLRAPDVLAQVSDQARKTQNLELQDIYRQLKKQIRVSLADAAHNDHSAEELESLLISPQTDDDTVMRRVH